MNMAIGKLEYVFIKIKHFNNSFIMLYTEYFTLRDCCGIVPGFCRSDHILLLHYITIIILLNAFIIFKAISFFLQSSMNCKPHNYTDLKCKIV